MQYEIHPLALAFPEMSDDEFADLKASIKDHGLRHKIVLLDGRVLDGRNRYRACLELKIPPIFREYDPALDGDLPASFVVDENLNRRNLTTGQRAAIAAELEPYFAEAIAAKKTTSKPAKKEEGPKSEKPAPAPSAIEKMQAIHGLEAGAILDGAVAAATGKGLDDNPHPAGHPARGLWKRGWERETARQAETEEEEPPADEIPMTHRPDPAPAEESEPDKPKAEEPAAPKTAAGKAAAATGVSERTVHDAKALKEKAPDEFEKVKKGEKSVAAAKKDAETIGQSISPYRAECADLLEAPHGEEFSEAVRNVTLLKAAAELEAFMKLTLDHQKETIPFIVKGWKVGDAIKFLRGEFDAGTTVGELMSYANAKGGSAEVTVGEFKIAISK